MKTMNDAGQVVDQQHAMCLALSGFYDGACTRMWQYLQSHRRTKLLTELWIVVSNYWANQIVCNYLDQNKVARDIIIDICMYILTYFAVYWEKYMHTKKNNATKKNISTNSYAYVKEMGWSRTYPMKRINWNRGDLAQTWTKSFLTVRKVSLCVWWDCQENTYYEPLLYDQTLNSHQYCQLLDRLK